MTSPGEPGPQSVTPGSRVPEQSPPRDLAPGRPTRSTSPLDEPGSAYRRSVVDHAADAALAEQLARSQVPRQHVPVSAGRVPPADRPPQLSLSALLSFTLGGVALALSVIPGLEHHAFPPAFGGLVLGVPTWLAAQHGRRPGAWVALAAVLLSVTALLALLGGRLLSA